MLAPYPGAVYFGQYAGSYDTTAPISTFVSQTRQKVSAITGANSTDVTWSVDETAQAWQFRVVPSTASTVTAGTLIKQATGVSIPANVNQVTNITKAELTTAGAVEGTNIVKLFAQDLAGNWSV